LFSSLDTFQAQKQPLRCGPLYRPGKLWVLPPFSHRIGVDPGKDLWSQLAALGSGASKMALLRLGRIASEISQWPSEYIAATASMGRTGSRSPIPPTPPALFAILFIFSGEFISTLPYP
jgi:hypothetical protein